jgi:hypothetical protein
MASPYQPGGVTAAFGGGGVPYHDAAPRMAVWAETPMDTCDRCSWTVRRRPDGSWCRFLLAVHGTCPQHRELRKNWKAPGSALTPTIGAREAAPAGKD